MPLPVTPPISGTDCPSQGGNRLVEILERPKSGRRVLHIPAKNSVQSPLHPVRCACPTGTWALARLPAKRVGAASPAAGHRPPAAGLPPAEPPHGTATGAVTLVPTLLSDGDAPSRP